MTERRKPIFLVETRQVSADGGKDYVTPEGIRVAPALRLLGELV